MPICRWFLEARTTMYSASPAVWDSVGRRTAYSVDCKGADPSTTFLFQWENKQKPQVFVVFVVDFISVSFSFATIHFVFG